MKKIAYKFKNVKIYLNLYCFRYLVSAKNISAGEVIIREDPVVVGPATFNKSSLCFSCLRHLSAASKKSHYICSKCNVAPLCNSFCEVNI